MPSPGQCAEPRRPSTGGSVLFTLPLLWESTVTKVTHRNGLFGLRVPEASWKLRAHVLSHKQETESANWKGCVYSKGPLQQCLLQQGCTIQTSPPEAASPRGFKLRLWGSLVTKPPRTPPAGKCPEQLNPQCRRQAGSYEGGVGAVGLPGFKKFPSRVMKIFRNQTVAVLRINSPRPPPDSELDS